MLERIMGNVLLYWCCVAQINSSRKLGSGAVMRPFVKRSILSFFGTRKYVLSQMGYFWNLGDMIATARNYICSTTQCITIHLQGGAPVSPALDQDFREIFHIITLSYLYDILDIFIAVFECTIQNISTLIYLSMFGICATIFFSQNLFWQYIFSQQ